MALKPKNKKEEERGSFKPSDATAGGGAVPSGPGKIVQARFAHFDYDEKELTDDQAQPFGLALQVKMDDEEEERMQFYSGGSKAHAIDDGKAFSGAPGLPDSSNAMALIQSLIECGFDDNKFDDGDISVLDGLEVVFEEKAQPVRNGGKMKASDRPKTFALVVEISGGKKKTATTTKAKDAAEKPKEKKKEEPEQADDSNKFAQEYIHKTLKAAGKAMTRKTLSQKAFKELKGDERDTVVELLGNNDFLGADDAPWNFDGDELELA